MCNYTQVPDERDFLRVIVGKSKLCNGGKNDCYSEQFDFTIW
jgi:hypothetical protein